MAFSTQWSNINDNGVGTCRKIGTVVFRLLSIAGLMLLICCASTVSARQPVRVLFVGNSVTYVNNLPAVFEAIAAKQPDQPVYRSDLVAHGGATLTDHFRDSRLRGLVASAQYDVVVLQERGGDDLCVLASEDRETDSCKALVDSHLQLAKLAREHGARVLYLGTYQFSPQASRALVRAESRLSKQMAAEYVEVSERLRNLRQSAPQLPWLDTDQAHPGLATTALMAVLLYDQLAGVAALPFELCTGAEMYPPRWQHDGVIHHTKISARALPVRCLLGQAQMDVITRGAVGVKKSSPAPPRAALGWVGGLATLDWVRCCWTLDLNAFATDLRACGAGDGDDARLGAEL